MKEQKQNPFSLNLNNDTNKSVDFGTQQSVQFQRLAPQDES